MSAILIRSATIEDVPLVLSFIRALAEYEHLEHTVMMREETLRTWMSLGGVHALIAEYHGVPVGFALYYFTYATFRAQRGLFLEDLFVRPEYRKQGLGMALFKALAKEAQQQDCYRMDWLVLNWNTKSIAFYQQLGAEPIDEWSLYRLNQNALCALRS